MLLHLCRNFMIAACIVCSSINHSYAPDTQIFSDFLVHQQLHHGIIVNAPTANVGQKFNLLANDEGLVQIWRHKRLSIYNVAAGGAAFEQQFYFSSPRVGVFVLNALCNLTQSNVFVPASVGSFFNNSQAWLLMVKAQQDGSSELQSVSKLFESYNINIDADITLAIELKNATILLYDIYKICHRCGTALEVVFKGYWQKKSGFVWQEEFHRSFVQRRHDFRGLALKSSAVVTEKPAHLTNLEHLDNEVDNKQFDFMQRKTFQLLKMMQPMMNFSFDVIFTGFWGQYKNNEWNGVVADLVHGRAELGVSPVRFAKDRVAAIRYTPELHTEIIRFLFRHPRRTVIRNIFLEPFEMSVWWCVFALIICAIFLLWLLVRQELCCQRQRHSDQQQQQQQKQNQQKQKQQGQHQNPCRLISTKMRPSRQTTIGHQQQPQLHAEQYRAPITTSPSPYNQATTTLEPRLDFSMLIILTAIFMQGPSPEAFNLISTRTLITTICVFSVMLLQFYGAFIVGSLLSDAPRSITSMHTLYNSSLDIGMENISYNFEFFINSSNPMARDIYAQRICKNPRRNILAMKQGVERIGGGGFAYHTGVERAYRILQYELNELEFCELQEVAMEPPFSSSGATSHDSPFREHYANAVLRFRLTGLMQYNDKKWQVKKTDCSLVRSTEVEVDIEHFLPALAFLACSMLMTLLILLLELGIHFWQKRCKSKIKMWYLKRN